MTTSRISAPVATVQEELDHHLDADDYRDEICNVSTMSRSASPPIENVIKSFHDQLDDFGKSFDDLASSIKNQKPPPSARTPSANSYNRQPIYRFSGSSTKKKTTPPLSRVRDPPPSSFADRLTPLRTYNDPPPSSADRHTPLRNYAQRGTPKHRVSGSSPSFSEGPPAPVETPGYFVASPSAPVMSTPNPNRRGGHQSDRQRRAAQPPTSLPVENLEVHLAPNDWEETLNKMRQTLQDQENRIQHLEAENQMLRGQLQDQSNYLQENPNSKTTNEQRLYHEDLFVHRGSSPPWQGGGEEYPGDRVGVGVGGDTSRYSVVEESNNRGRRGEPNGRPPATPASSSRYHHTTPPVPVSTPSFRSLRSPPSRIRTANSQQMIPEEGRYTPGTRFVAELSQLMRMGNEHHAPLSCIIDKHWDQLRDTFYEENML